MKLDFLQTPTEPWFIEIPKTKEHPRHYKTIVDLEITLSDGYILKVDRGKIWDGASVPSWAHWLFPPIDEGAIGDFIHDVLWEDKQGQFEYFNYNIYKAREFADNERKIWRKKTAPNRNAFNKISNFVIRLIGGLYYSKQIQIPN